MSEPEEIPCGEREFAALVREQTLRAFGLKPWHIGLAPVPFRVRIWRKVTFSRWRVRRMLRKEGG